MGKLVAFLGSTVTLLVGCASQPGPTQPATALAAAPETGAAVAETMTVVDDPPGPPPGWTAKKRSGAIVYCRVVNVTGSMFPQEACLKPAELEEALRVQKTNAQRTLGRPQTADTGG